MRGGVTLLTVLLCLVTASMAFRCDRTPEGTVAPKIPADNRFQLKISGTPEMYVPGEGYTISIEAKRQGQVAQKFIAFSLVVEPQNYSPLRVMTARDITPRPIGTFTLYGDSMTKFSPSCPNMVTQTSSMPKTEVQVRWTAPPPGSGCIIFRATVVENWDVWYQDDGPLSRMLCEEVQENMDLQPDIMDYCCACDEAKYEVTFEGLWSRHTHPKDFPSNTWLTRFSDIIGASHSPHYKFWEYGGFASEGLRHVSERGSTRMLESELKSHSSEIRTIIKARGIGYPNVTGKTFAVFRVNRHHHLMSLVSMIDPSPDWIVGVSALELCLKNCSWVESKILNLYPWDAGTDSGITYVSPDLQTKEREKIRRITSSFPNDPRSPFYDSSGLEMKPLARLYLTRQRLYEKTCDEGPVGNGCELTSWSAWGPCSASCGQGMKFRRREYLRPRKNCPRNNVLTESWPCVSRHCRPLVQPTKDLEEDSNCELKEWTDWSRCMPTDNSCKQGVQVRYRNVMSKDRRKYCLKVRDIDKQPCVLSIPPSTCPKNYRGKVIHQDPQSSTCCEDNRKDAGEETQQEDLYGIENSETTDQDFPDEHGVEENDTNDNGDDDREGNGTDGREENGEVEREENGDAAGGENGEVDGGENGEDAGEENDNGEENDRRNSEGNNVTEQENTYENGDAEEKIEHNDLGEENGDHNNVGEGYGELNGEENVNEVDEGDEQTEVGGNGNEDATDYNDNYDDGVGDNKMNIEEPSGECAMTMWSRWSPCSVSCGVGVKKRSRELLNPIEGPQMEYQRAPPPHDSDYGTYDDEIESEGEYAQGPCSAYKVQEVKSCNGTYHSCQLSPEDAREICALPPHPGLCRGPLLMRWHYEPKIEECSQFEWTGCRGNKNRFLTRDECKFACQAYTAEGDDQTTTEEATTGDEENLEALSQTKDLSEVPVEGTEHSVRNCKFSRWSDWSECDAPCNQPGFKVRTRYIEIHAKNGGRQCSNKTRKQKRCFRRCKDNGCKYDEWSSWTACTASCGLSSVRQQTRQVVFGNPIECDDRVRKQPCNVGACPH